MATEQSTNHHQPLFSDFNRYPLERFRNALIPGDAFAGFVELVADLAGGVETIIELTVDDDLREQRRDDSDVPRVVDRPLLSAAQLWTLQRLAQRSMNMLGEKCDSMVTWAVEHHTPEARAKRREGLGANG